MRDSIKDFMTSLIKNGNSIVFVDSKGDREWEDCFTSICVKNSKKHTFINEFNYKEKKGKQIGSELVYIQFPPLKSKINVGKRMIENFNEELSSLKVKENTAFIFNEPDKIEFDTIFKTLKEQSLGNDFGVYVINYKEGNIQMDEMF